MRYLWSVLPVALALGGCADLNKSLTEANNSLLTGRTMASATTSTTETRIEVPNDPRISKAFNEALPNIKTIMGIHKCINHQDGMLLLNKETVPGAGVNANSMGWGGNLYPNSAFFMKYHNRGKCLDVRAIDNISMPANNALLFRAVFYAEDSGETVSFKYLMKRMDNGQWLLGEQPRAAQ